MGKQNWGKNALFKLEFSGSIKPTLLRSGNILNLSVIIISYNARSLLMDCIHSLKHSLSDLSYEIIIFDNNSSDGSSETIQKSFPYVFLIRNDVNVGYARANNKAYKKSKGEFLLFLNSDTIVKNNSIQKMIKYMLKNHNVGILGPKIMNKLSCPTRSYMRFLNLKTFFLGTKYLKNFLDINKYRIHYSDYDYDSIQSVEWLSGACMLVRRHVFEKAGLFDENYFLYFEDMDICLQVKRLGYDIVYFPYAEIIHFFGRSSLNFKSKELKRIYNNSKQYYFRKNFSFIHYFIFKFYHMLFG